MKASKNKLLIVIIILIGMANSKLDACSCDTISFKDAIEYADEIFVGKITKVERFENGKFVNADHREEANWDWRYYFEIENKWKGNNKSKLIVHHQGTSCDLFFDIYEREYLVYASRKSGKENLLGVTIGPNNGKDKLTTWLCSRTIHNHYWEEENWFKDDIDNLESDVYFTGDDIQLALEKAISQLPEKQRLVFQMKYYQDMKYDDISEILGTSVGALKSSYHIATKKLTSILTQD